MRNTLKLLLASVEEARVHFHKSCAISTAENLLTPLAFSEIASMLQINGREIFQKERVDKEPSGEPATDLARYSGNRKPWMEPRKLLQRNVATEKFGKRGPQGSQVLSDFEVTNQL